VAPAPALVGNIKGKNGGITGSYAVAAISTAQAPSKQAADNIILIFY